MRTILDALTRSVARSALPVSVDWTVWRDPGPRQSGGTTPRFLTTHTKLPSFPQDHDMKLIAMLALGGFAALTIAVPTADAAPPCSASGLATTASGVLAQAGTYLDAHPEANDVLTAAG